MLEPYSVLDFTDERGEIGPMLLGDLGADVIRVELPTGVSSRACEPLLHTEKIDHRANAPSSLPFVAFNRNKRSIELDASKEADRETLETLIRQSEFIFESYPNSVLQEFGIDFDRACELNPHIVYVRLSPLWQRRSARGLPGQRSNHCRHGWTRCPARRT